MRKNNIGKKILNAIFISGALYLSLSSPRNINLILNRLPQELKKYRKSQLYRALHYLRSQNRIKIIKTDDRNISAVITEDGKKYLKSFDFDNLSLLRPKKWDKKWRLVIFDVPEKKKKVREALRDKLRDLGLVKLQDSIWVTPFSCEKEISLIKNTFALSDYWIDVIITDNLGANEYKLRNYFDLI